MRYNKSYTAHHLRVIAAYLLSATGIPSLTRALIVRNGRFALTFHDIIRTRRSDLTRQSQYGLSVDEFESTLNWLRAHFNFLSLSAFLSGQEGGGVLLTFDDGKANNFTNLLPILEKYQAPAVYFVSTQHIVSPRNWLPYTRRCAQTQWTDLHAVPNDLAWEYYNGMTPDQIAYCGRHELITLGAHTVSHPFLTTCDDQSLWYELYDAKQQLESISEQSINVLAYPSGDYNRRVADAAQDAGYHYAFALTPRKVALPQYEIPRIYVGDSHLFTLKVKLSGFHLRPLRRNILLEESI